MLILLVGQDKILNKQFAKGLTAETSFNIPKHQDSKSLNKNTLLSYYTKYYNNLIKNNKNSILLDNHITNEINRLVNDFDNESFYGMWREMEDKFKNNMLVVFIVAIRPNNDLNNNQRLMYKKEVFDIFAKYTRLNWIITKNIFTLNHEILNEQISETLKIITRAKKEFNQSRLKFIK